MRGGEICRERVTALMSLAEATGAGGQLKIYRMVNDTAEAFGVRQVQFSDTFTAREDDTLSAWRVQFTLTEQLSNPERVETRRPASPVQKQSGTGAVVADPSVAGTAANPSTPAAPGAPELSGFEEVLKRVDDYIGPEQ